MALQVGGPPQRASPTISSPVCVAPSERRGVEPQPGNRQPRWLPASPWPVNTSARAGSSRWSRRLA